MLPQPATTKHAPTSRPNRAQSAVFRFMRPPLDSALARPVTPYCVRWSGENGGPVGDGQTGGERGPAADTTPKRVAVLAAFHAICPRDATSSREFVPVVAYDRAGMGRSEADGERPTPQHIAENLRALLDGLGAAPPYVLVGYRRSLVSPANNVARCEPMVFMQVLGRAGGGRW